MLLEAIGKMNRNGLPPADWVSLSFLAADLNDQLIEDTGAGRFLQLFQ